MGSSPISHTFFLFSACGERVLVKCVDFLKLDRFPARSARGGRSLARAKPTRAKDDNLFDDGDNGNNPTTSINSFIGCAYVGTDVGRTQREDLANQK
jgi:hypothetical protein